MHTVIMVMMSPSPSMISHVVRRGGLAARTGGESTVEGMFADGCMVDQMLACPSAASAGCIYISSIHIVLLLGYAALLNQCCADHPFLD